MEQAYNKGPREMITSHEIGQESLSQERDTLLKIAITRYSLKVQGVENQIREINDSRKENTGIVGGMGDWIGEKTGSFETGKAIYESQIQQAHERAKAIYTQLLTEFSGKTLSPTEQASINTLIQKLEQVTGTNLTEISWGKAVFNSAGVDGIH
jgi:hypothetical protein